MFLKRSAFVMTDTELKLIAAAAITGESKTPVTILREKKEMSIEVTVGERPENIEQAGNVSSTSWRVVAVMDRDSYEARQFDITADRGVVVINVQQGSAAEEAGSRCATG